MRFTAAAAVASILIVQSLARGQEARGHEAIRDLLAAAVAERVGGGAGIDVAIVGGPGVEGPFLSASPVPGSRLGLPMRFTLSRPDAPAASVVAHVRVVAPHVVVRQAIARDARVTADDVEVRTAGVDGVVLQPLPVLDEVLQATARRALAAGEIVTRSVLAQTPAVRAGDEVRITVRRGAVEVQGVGRAVSSGSVGDVIRVTRPGSREMRRARVVAPAAVELM